MRPLCLCELSPTLIFKGCSQEVMLPPMDLTPAPSCPPEGAHQRFADDASSCAGATGLRHCHDATHQDHDEAHLQYEQPEGSRGGRAARPDGQ